jgi:hypothetical protein
MNPIDDRFLVKDFREQVRAIIKTGGDPIPARGAYVNFSNLRSASLMTPEEARERARTPEQLAVVEAALRRLHPDT